MTEYIYIAQQQKEETRVKIGKTGDYETRLKQYNGTGTPKDNQYNYLFVAEVKDMTEMENNIKEKYKDFKEQENKEMYVWIPSTNKSIIDFIKTHNLFIKEIPIKKPKEKIKVVREKQKTLIERGKTKIDIMQNAKNKATTLQDDPTLSTLIDHDEYYTQIEDVEKEVANYKPFFENKVVFCNCDDPYDEKDESKSSAFALYFYRNFNKLKLKKLICLHYSGGVDLFNQGKSGIIFTTDGKKWQQETHKNYDGSFDHPLSIKILNDEADIICTNPPFSRAREYWKLVIESGKKFLIISNIANAVTESYIKYFKNKQVWSGINSVNCYINPKGLKGGAPGHWYTNFPIKKHNSTIKLIPLKDIPEKDKKIDDKGILNIDRCKIPSDYDKPFAVSTRPILQRVLDYGFEIVQCKDSTEWEYYPYINKNRKFGRVLIQKIK
ncbi:MAG: hypothetical protein Ta2D_05130 [Rickettsiales bacterium]|nr:MAG: hypothetical protein Ta2D_05130 [Rickettsiales bacterium]